MEGLVYKILEGYNAKEIRRRRLSSVSWYVDITRIFACKAGEADRRRRDGAGTVIRYTSRVLLLLPHLFAPHHPHRPCLPGPRFDNRQPGAVRGKHVQGCDVDAGLLVDRGTYICMYIHTYGVGNAQVFSVPVRYLIMW